MVRIEFTIKALNDLTEIKDYISKDSEFYAKSQIEKIIKTISYLEDNIKVGRKVPEVNNENIREIIKSRYRIVYQVQNPDLIRILTIHHSSKKFNLPLN